MQNQKFVGVDCHKNTIACYVNGKFKEFKTDFKGFQKALQWAGNDCCWALEGAYSYGLTFSVFLLESGCKVYEFNALATAKARKALSICGEKMIGVMQKLFRYLLHNQNYKKFQQKQ